MLTRWNLLSVAAVAVGAIGVAFPVADVVKAAPAPVNVYDAITNPVPGNVSSHGFQANRTSALGDLVQLAPGPRRLHSVTVMMSSWGCQQGGWSTASTNPCVTAPGATFDHPLTLTMYESDPTSSTGIGAQVLTQTTTFAIPFRPSADPTCVGSDAGKWRSGATCYNGFATPVTFTFPSLPSVPTNLVWALSFNTTSYGTAPMGPTCATDTFCGYDSLNVGLEAQPSSPSAGYDLGNTSVLARSGSAGVDCAGGSNVVRVTTGCWTSSRPMAEISTLAATDNATTQVIKAMDTSWAFFAERSTAPSPPATGSYVTGPATAPLGDGSAQLTVSGDEGQAFGALMHAGVKLDRLTQLSYSSQQPGGGPIAPSLQFPVRYDGTAGPWQGRLVYEPTYTLGGPVPAGWQTWNTLTGRWWATGEPGKTMCPQGNGCTWSQILVAYPNAVINPDVNAGGFLFKIGSGIPAFTGQVDALKVGVDDGLGNINTTTYDFEPTVTPPDAPPVTPAIDPPVTPPIDPPVEPPVESPGTLLTGGAAGARDYNPVTPTRVFDTRVGTPAYLRDVAKLRVGPNTPLEVKLTDLPGLVPAGGVGAVSMNITSTQSQGAGYVTVSPCPAINDVSSVNFQAAADRANAAITPVSATGTVCFTSSVDTDLAVDVNGWFRAVPGLHTVTPTRVFDTRPGAPAALRDVPKMRVEPGHRLEVKLTDLPGGLVPETGIGAVSINVTSTQSAGDGFVTVSPCTTDDAVSNVNFQGGDDAANLVLTPVSATGTVCFAASVATDLIVDINGWFATSSGFTSVNPTRVADTREGAAGLRDVPKGRVGPGDTLEVKLTDLPGYVPAGGVGAVSLNVTSTRSLGDGFLSVSPCGSTNDVSSLNYQAGRDRANAVLTPVSAAGTVCITASQPTDVIIDVTGWFSDKPTTLN